MGLQRIPFPASSPFSVNRYVRSNPAALGNNGQMFKLIVREELDMATADRPTLFINATVLDGSEHMEPQPDMAVAVERGVITWMGPSAVAQAPAGAEVIDLAGAYLMPGLINMHVHLCGSGKPVSAGDAGALMKKLDNPVGRTIVRHILKGSAQQQLASGVTTVRGAGDPLFADLAVRNAIDAGKYQGPRLVTPGTGVRVATVRASLRRWQILPQRQPSRCATCMRAVPMSSSCS